MAGHHLDVAAEQQQEHEHRHRVEVDLAVAAEGVDGADDVGAEDAERDRQVHGHPAMHQAGDGTADERPGRIGGHRRRDDEAGDAQIGADDRFDAMERTGIEADGNHHDLHHAEAGDHQPLERGAPLAGGHLERVGLAEQVRRVAEIGDGAECRRYACAADVEHKLAARGRRVQAQLMHARQLREALFNEPGAGRTAGALDQQLQPQRAVRPAGLQGEHLVAIEGRKAIGREVSRTRCRGAAPAIIVG